MAIYDDDDTRRDLYLLQDPAIDKQAAAVALAISVDDLDDNGDGTFSPRVIVFGQRTQLADPPTLTLCPDQRFLTQPSAQEAYGTAWLVASSLSNGLMVTARHVLETALQYEDGDIGKLRFAFGWKMADAGAAVRIPAGNVYTAAQVQAQGASDAVADDWALIQVTAAVTGIAPLPLSAHLPQLNDALYCLSHPTQLPVKHSTGTVTDVADAGLFRASVTAFGGSSGAPVLDAATGTVSGIYVHGPVDYEAHGGCVVASNYPSTDLTEAGRIVRVQQFQGSIP
jgi:Flp pilus assembly protein TadG